MAKIYDNGQKKIKIWQTIGKSINDVENYRNIKECRIVKKNIMYIFKNLLKP